VQAAWILRIATTASVAPALVQLWRCHVQVAAMQTSWLMAAEQGAVKLLGPATSADIAG
jgi:hypothetical protein